MNGTDDSQGASGQDKRPTIVTPGQIRPLVLSAILEMTGLERTGSWKRFAFKVVGTVGVISGAFHAFLPPEHFLRIGLSIFAASLLVLFIVFYCLVIFLSRQFVQNRQEPFPAAREEFQKRMQSKRVDRCQQFHFDVFMPPTPSGERHSKGRVVPGFIFLPGALVDHVAYAPLAAKLSDRGIIVVVMSFEPLRFGTPRSGASFDSVKIIMDYVATHHAMSFQVTDWSVGGHSAGGSASFNILVESRAKSTPHYCGPTPVHFNKLVLLGSGSPAEKKGSLRTINHPAAVDNSNDKVHVLSITASNDGLLNKFLTPALEEKFKTQLVPDDTIHASIKGGNHAGFGHYGPQTFPVQDGERSISLEDQQDQTVDLISSFLVPQNNGQQGQKKTN